MDLVLSRCGRAEPVDGAARRWPVGHSGGMTTERIDQETRLAKRIEAGLLAQELLDRGSWEVEATPEELQSLAEEGRRAKEELVLAHLGLVSVIAAEAARRARCAGYADLFQEGCVALHQAVLSYDWRKGPFGPYAGMWIRSGIKRVRPRRWAVLDETDLEDGAPVRALDRSVTQAGLAQVLQVIPAPQSRVLRLRSGWEGEPRTRQAVADELGLTVAKVRHLERMGLESVRREWELAEAA